MKGIKLIVFLTLLTSVYHSQSDSVLAGRANGRVLLRLGKNAIKQKDPVSAITFLETYLKKFKKKDQQALKHLGFAYMQVRDYDRAQKVFLRSYKASKVGKSKKYKTSEALYYYALMQKSNGLYDSAKINFSLFKKEYKGSNKLVKKQATKEIAYCDSVSALIANKKNISITHLDSSINKVNTEAAPIQMDDSTLIYTSLKTEQKEFTSEEDTGKSLKRKLFFARYHNGKWTFRGEFGNGINDPEFNTGNACLSPDKKRLYFTRCRPDYMGKMICAIFVTEKKGEEWSEPQKLPKTVNDPRYTSTMPSLTADPAKGTDILYFVSDNKKGRGGMDIWYAVYDKKRNIYKQAKNAGNKINTSQNEISPFFDTETRCLYYSSDGLGGLGGYDVFKALGDGRRWTGVQNVGVPVNTGADEIYYTISPKRDVGFFVSNRKGGNSLNNATCCDDIYQYTDNDYSKIILKGNISEMLDPFSSISGASIEVFIKNPKGDEKFYVKTIESDEKGNYRVGLEPGHEYYLVAKKSDYLGTSGEVSTVGVKTDKVLEKDLSLFKHPKDPIHIPNIQYEFDRSNILEASKLALDTTVLRLMLLNPELLIEIQAHTDSKGNDKYNLKLSQKRAESVVNYLVSKGIDIKRLKAKGYGESRPVAPNENSDGTDNPDGRAKNRRTDFKIIGVVDAEVINDGQVN